MKKIFILFLLTLTLGHLFSQSLPKKLNQANWQQKVDFETQVSLNVNTHSLNAFEKITYTNNSPNTLTEIYIHLWPNAYKNRTTAYAKQDLENGKTDFYFSQENDRGYIDSLDFKVNGQNVKFILTPDIDIAILKLNMPLKSGEKLEITTPFYVKLPKVFSRMGYEDSIYCITQWYPKPAVYDINGWNPMPYLNQGEFYSEYGMFHISITVPKDYVLAATGEVQDPNEKKWWTQRMDDPKAPHFSVTPSKTLSFVQDSVHDFAWFCSPLFMCDKSELTLSNGKKVETWLFGKSPDGKNKPKGILSINEGVKFYSDKVGNYPYSIAQVVITPLEAGGGMEYPTITNCASNDKTTIVHEIGHNWFYGILGSNEREYPWMDESINTYYENRNTNEGKKIKTSEKKSNLNSLFSSFDQSEFLYNYSARKNLDQPGNLHSMDYTDNNYGAIIYAKNPIGFSYLQAYLGTQKFDAMMQAYYEKWKFKHPLPNDFKDHAEAFTKEDLSWFFNGVLGTKNKLDYKLIKVKNGTLTAKNNGNLIAPMAITQKINNDSFNTQWIQGFSGTKSLILNTLGFQNTDNKFAASFQIDGQNKSSDLYRLNNKRSPIKLQPILSLENNQNKQLFWAPIYGYNVYNKSMLGLAFYNSLLPQKRNEFVLAPLYSFGTKNLNGYAEYWHNWYPQGKIRNIQLGFKSARFASQGVFYNSGDPVLQNYISQSGNYFGNVFYEKLAPFLAFHLQPKTARSRINQSIQLRYVMINEQARDRNMFYQFGSDHYGISELKYAYQNPNALYPIKANFYLQNGLHNVSFNKIGLEIIQGITYAKGKNKKAEIRLFAGGFLFQKSPITNSPGDLYGQRAMLQGGANAGVNDYLYDNAMMGRMVMSNSNTNQVFGHQILLNESGFRNFANIGSSQSILSALNLTIPVPIPVPIGLYADFSYWQSPSSYHTINGIAGVTVSYIPAKMNLTYNGGIYINIVRDVFSIYVPLISSSDVQGYWDLNKHESFFSRASFVLNLNKINPITLIRDIKL
ncbi:MAG: M1 family metallopeptidase [bacterium]|nr:M1 family metallopeptidase [bacterium]